MKTNQRVSKVAYSVQFDAPGGPCLVIHPRSTHPPDLQGKSLPISRQSMASIVRRWRALGAPSYVRGFTYASTAILAMARLRKLEITALAA